MCSGEKNITFVVIQLWKQILYLKIFFKHSSTSFLSHCTFEYMSYKFEDRCCLKKKSNNEGGGGREINISIKWSRLIMDNDYTKHKHQTSGITDSPKANCEMNILLVCRKLWHTPLPKHLMCWVKGELQWVFVHWEQQLQNQAGELLPCMFIWFGTSSMDL